MRFGETLASLRKSKGFSQEQLAEKLNLTRQTVSKWELNQSTPDIDYIIQLSEIFKVSTDYLIKGKQNNSDNTDLKLSDNAQIQVKSNDIIIHKWCIIFGVVLMTVSIIGISAFVLCSALNPCSFSYNDLEFDALLGYLLCTKTLWFFIVLSLLFIVGGLISIYSIIKEFKKR